jgi:L-threonylcarbamoyladenylate synthase
MPPPKTYRIDPENPDADIIHKAAALIRKGGVVAFPTRCLYGLGADAFNREAVDRIFKIKQRPPAKPILLLIDDPARLAPLVSRITASAEDIIKRFWPGRVTLIFEASERVPDDLMAGTAKIGIRLAGHPAAAQLAAAVQGPITGTSANLSGQPGCHRVEDLPTAVIDKLDLILDAGPLKGGRGSTVVDVSGNALKILREGVVSKQDILSITGGH